MNQQLYPTDMTDSQWNIIQQMIPPAKSDGRPRMLDMRQVINAIFRLVVSGIQWRMLPKDYPKWQSVYYYFRNWRDDGLWQQIHDTLRAEVRRKEGRHKHPTPAVWIARVSKVASIQMAFVVLMVVSQSRVGNDISWSIPAAGC